MPRVRKIRTTKIGPPKKGYMSKSISKYTKKLLKPYNLKVKR